MKVGKNVTPETTKTKIFQVSPVLSFAKVSITF